MTKKILIADDSPNIRKALCRLFEFEENYDVCADATNGQDVIDLAQMHHPDLIILDLAMPVLNGSGAARKLKKMMPEVPIILFTQCADLSNHLGPNDLPVDRIVSKSDIKELMRHVKSIVPAKKESAL
jgi:DNA-binding NarL/FixJ family response regulator